MKFNFSFVKRRIVRFFLFIYSKDTLHSSCSVCPTTVMATYNTNENCAWADFLIKVTNYAEWQPFTCLIIPTNGSGKQGPFQSHPFISLSSPPSQNDSSIHLSADPWLQFHHKSAEQTDEEEKRRGAQGEDKGLGILCGQLAKGSAIVLQTKKQWWKAVVMLRQRRNGNGCRDYEALCMCAPEHVSL